MTWVFAALVTALRAGLGGFRCVHAGLLGDGPAAARRRRGSRRSWRSPRSRNWPSRRLKRLMAAGLPGQVGRRSTRCTAAAGSSAAALRALGLAYVVIIPCDYRVTLRRTRSSALTRPSPARCSSGGPAGTGRRAPATADWALTRHRGPAGVPADPPPARPAGEPVHVLPVLGAGRPAGDHDVFHHHRRPPLASRSRPPLLPVKRDLSFTAALLVLLPAFRRFLPGVVPSGRGCSSRAGGPCARGARASAARRR